MAVVSMARVITSLLYLAPYHALVSPLISLSQTSLALIPLLLGFHYSTYDVSSKIFESHDLVTLQPWFPE